MIELNHPLKNAMFLLVPEVLQLDAASATVYK